MAVGSQGRRSEVRNSLRPLYTGQLTARVRGSISFCTPPQRVTYPCVCCYLSYVHPLTFVYAKWFHAPLTQFVGPCLCANTTQLIHPCTMTHSYVYSGSFLCAHICGAMSFTVYPVYFSLSLSLLFPLSHTHAHARTHTHTNAHAHAHTHTHTQTYTRTCTHTNIHTHTHGHMDMRWQWYSMKKDPLVSSRGLNQTALPAIVHIHYYPCQSWRLRR